MPFLVLHLKEIIVFVWQGFSCKDIPSGDARNKTWEGVKSPAIGDRLSQSAIPKPFLGILFELTQLSILTIWQGGRPIILVILPIK